jgi:hypothetical protein
MPIYCARGWLVARSQWEREEGVYIYEARFEDAVRAFGGGGRGHDEAADTGIVKEGRDSELEAQ